MVYFLEDSLSFWQIGVLPKTASEKYLQVSYKNNYDSRLNHK